MVPSHSVPFHSGMFDGCIASDHVIKSGDIVGMLVFYSDMCCQCLVTIAFVIVAYDVFGLSPDHVIKIHVIDRLGTNEIVPNLPMA